MPKIKHTRRGWVKDQKDRSKQDWERGLGAPRTGNPRYKPKVITNKNGDKQKVYVLRIKDKK